MTGAYGEYITSNTVRFERLVPGPIERVWEYLTESDKRATWLGSGGVPDQVGAIFHTSWDNSKLGSKTGQPPERYRGRGVHTGTHKVTRYQPPRLLAFKWDETSGDKSSEVTFELKPQGDKVLLILTHEHLPTRKDVLGVSGGWHTHLDLLSDILNGRDPGSFWENFSKIDGTYDERLAK